MAQKTKQQRRGVADGDAPTDDKGQSDLEAEVSEGDESPSDTETPKRPSDNHNPDRHRRETYRIAIVSAIVGAVATVVLASVASPIRDWMGGSVDAVHDALLGYNGRQVDDAKERIESRPFWADDPSFAQSSFDFLSGHLDDAEPISTLEEGSTSARVVSVDELVTDAPELEGIPVVLIGKIYSRTLLGGSDIDLTYEEEILTGADRYAYVGINEFTASSSFHDVVAVVGLLAATGRVQDADVPAGVETVYFISLGGIPVGPRNPAFRSKLAELLPAKFLD